MYNVILLCTSGTQTLSQKLVNSVYSSMDGQNLSWLCDDEAVCFHVEKRAQRIMKYGRSYSD